ncbi:MAG: BlaI/MecI/CopY family transcriptional regulator [Candidatus Brocadiaceae bacterium]|nr:BlaI/MecI/CopY family transcriptional regulator [Candidatus Brocadiaceae bacterium]
MKEQIKFKFNPFKKGLNRVLGTLEKDIIEVLWKFGELCVKDILEELPEGKNSSYSAVITVANRMTEKGLLKKRKIGKAFYYKPLQSKEKFFKMISKRIVEEVSDFSPQLAMVHFVDYMEQIGSDKIEYFSKLIESRKQKQKS